MMKNTVVAGSSVRFMNEEKGSLRDAPPHHLPRNQVSPFYWSL